LQEPTDDTSKPKTPTENQLRRHGRVADHTVEPASPINPVSRDTEDRCRTGSPINPCFRAHIKQISPPKRACIGHATRTAIRTNATYLSGPDVSSRIFLNCKLNSFPSLSTWSRPRESYHMVSAP